jgi:diguanylate cyclase (GGDEF)-like protein
MQYFGSTSGLSTVLWAATMVAVIVRLGISVRENKELLLQLRTDPLTGLGSRGAMRVDFDALCAKATPELPIVLLLFDLNGFKRYNDSFGHPAGDELLSRLGERLRSVLDGNGEGYRIGGDEFCAVLTCGHDRLDDVLRRATSALTESDRGVDVAASWGVVSVPGEATSPREALQLADLRMYAQKESRRVARESGSAFEEALDAASLAPGAIEA